MRGQVFLQFYCKKRYIQSRPRGYYISKITIQERQTKNIEQLKIPSRIIDIPKSNKIKKVGMKKILDMSMAKK